MKKQNQRHKLRKLRRIALRKWMADNGVAAETVLAASRLVGERCQGCGCAFPTVRDVLTDTVWWPWSKGRIAHRACYRRANP